MKAVKTISGVFHEVEAATDVIEAAAETKNAREPSQQLGIDDLQMKTIGEAKNDGGAGAAQLGGGDLIVVGADQHGGGGATQNGGGGVNKPLAAHVRPGPAHVSLGTTHGGTCRINMGRNVGGFGGSQDNFDGGGRPGGRPSDTKDILWVGYKNVNKVLKPGKRMYIDDGLISVVAKFRLVQPMFLMWATRIWLGI